MSLSLTMIGVFFIFQPGLPQGTRRLAMVRPSCKNGDTGKLGLREVTVAIRHENPDWTLSILPCVPCLNHCAPCGKKSPCLSIQKEVKVYVGKFTLHHCTFPY